MKNNLQRKNIVRFSICVRWSHFILKVFFAHNLDKKSQLGVSFMFIYYYFFLCFQVKSLHTLGFLCTFCGQKMYLKYFLRKSQYPIYLQVAFCQTWIDLCHISYQHSVGKVSHSISTLETKNACKINQHYWKISYSYFTLNIANSNYPESSEW